MWLIKNKWSLSGPNVVGFLRPQNGVSVLGSQRRISARVVQGAGGAQVYSKRLKCTPAHPPPPPRFTLYTRLPCALYPFSLLSLISCEMASGVQDLQLVVFEVKQCLAIKKITPSVAIYSYPRTKPFMNKNTNTILSSLSTDRTDWTENITKTLYLTTKSIKIHV